jgi:RimJ/RimL family protein N-acetyltransferase
MHQPTLTTPRLFIRPFQPHDSQAVHTYTNSVSVMKYVPPHAMSWAQTQDFVAEQQGADAQALAIVHQHHRRLIGHIIFHAWFAPRTYELGWVIHPDYQRQGYATEAARALLEYAFTTLHAHRVIATCQPENSASSRVMEKLGMRREAHFHQCIHRGDNLWWDEYFYAVLASEWSIDR